MLAIVFMGPMRVKDDLGVIPNLAVLLLMIAKAHKYTYNFEKNPSALLPAEVYLGKLMPNYDWRLGIPPGPRSILVTHQVNVCTKSPNLGYN